MQALGASPGEVHEREQNVHAEHAVYNHREDELQPSRRRRVVVECKALGQ